MNHTCTSPQPPDAWLVVKNYVPDQLAPNEKVIGIFPSEADPELAALVAKENRELPGSARVVKDHPSEAVSYYGFVIQNPAWLTARDNWFQRYWPVLACRLSNPLTAQVFTFAPGELADPLGTHKSSADGPFFFPKGRPWPTCRSCGRRLAFLGTLDFREHDFPTIPRGALVVHLCQECGPFEGPETCALTWIMEREEVERMGDPSATPLVGTRWRAAEYPTPAIYPDDLISTGPLLQEDSIYFNFSCFADKVGGHQFWLQSYEDETPHD